MQCSLNLIFARPNARSWSRAVKSMLDRFLLEPSISAAWSIEKTFVKGLTKRHGSLKVWIEESATTIILNEPKFVTMQLNSYLLNSAGEPNKRSSKSCRKKQEAAHLRFFIVSQNTRLLDWCYASRLFLMMFDLRWQSEKKHKPAPLTTSLPPCFDNKKRSPVECSACVCYTFTRLKLEQIRREKKLHFHSLINKLWSLSRIRFEVKHMY